MTFAAMNINHVSRDLGFSMANDYRTYALTMRFFGKFLICSTSDCRGVQLGLRLGQLLGETFVFLARSLQIQGIITLDQPLIWPHIPNKGSGGY